MQRRGKLTVKLQPPSGKFVAQAPEQTAHLRLVDRVRRAEARLVLHSHEQQPASWGHQLGEVGRVARPVRRLDLSTQGMLERVSSVWYSGWWLC